MNLHPETLDYVCCPQCHGDLHYTKEEVLFCIKCRLCFQVEQGVPDLHVANALPVSIDGKWSSSEKKAYFIPENTLGAATQFFLTLGSCRVVGRQPESPSKEQVFNADFTISLDEPTRQLIRNALSTRYGKGLFARALSDFGPFKRLPDVLFSEKEMSQIHAFFYYSQEGVGVLDLVSRQGTFVNGKEIEIADIKAGDHISLGPVKFEVKLK